MASNSEKKFCHVCGKPTEHVNGHCREHDWKRETAHLLEQLRQVVEEEKPDDKDRD